MIKLLSFISIFLYSSLFYKPSPTTMVQIETTFGNITIILYNDTKLHKENFIKLVREGYYDGLLFHRVIPDFMIQTGDSDSKTAVPGQALGSGGPAYTIPAEFRKEYYHKKGALAAARQGNDVNPEMRSSGTQFYIVHGKKYSDAELKTTEDRINSNIKQSLFSKLIKEVADSSRLSGTPLQESEIQERASMKMFDYLTTHEDFKFSDEQINSYMNAGGTPRLDGTYTVFGEVIEGLETVDAIASVQTNQADKPLNDVKIITMKLVSR